MLTCSLRPTEPSLAFASVKTGQVTTCQRRPHDAVSIDIHATRRISSQLNWRFVVFRDCRFGRIGPRNEADDSAWEPQQRTPNRAIGRRRYRIKCPANALVLRRIQRLVWLNIRIAPAVAVGI